MSKILISGGRPLYGDVYVDGMKNAALPIIFASILTCGVSVIENLPPVSDTKLALQIIESMGGSVRYYTDTTVEINTRNFRDGVAPYDIVGKMRGSTYLLGAQLGRFGRTRLGRPGGCDFGDRKLDFHINGFRALGADVVVEPDCIYADVPHKLHGAKMLFNIASVGATVNIILASVMAEGMTVIENAAREPHIVDLANYLNTCGANITGAGTGVIKIRGVETLNGCSYTMIPDMIEAGTYMAAVAASGGRIRINNIIPKHLEIISAKLSEMGVDIECYDESLIVTSMGRLRNTSVVTMPYPGFPTDMHPQFSAIMCLAAGEGSVTERIWENRFKYVPYLNAMGADITVDDISKTAKIIGVEKLHGASVSATDLRAGAALIIAALAAEGETEISNVDYIKRGYTDIVGKLRSLGAEVSYVDD